MMMLRKISMVIGLLAPSWAAIPASAATPPTADALAEEKVIDLPAEVEQVEVAGGGRFLVLKLREVSALCILDAFSVALTQQIPLPTADFVYGAGGNLAVVYLPGDDVLQVYDLTSRERKLTKANPFGTPITNIALGHSRDDQALVRRAVPQGTRDWSVIALLDTSHLEAIRMDLDAISSAPSYVRPCDRLETYPNRDLSRVGIWCESLGDVITRQGRAHFAYSPHGTGYFAVGDDDHVYGHGSVFDSRMKADYRLDGQLLYPGLDSAFFVARAKDGQLSVYQTGVRQPLGQLGSFPTPAADPKANRSGSRRHQGPAYGRARQIVFIPLHGRIVFFPPDEKRAIIRPFDLPQLLASASTSIIAVCSAPSPLATVDIPWSYQMKTISRAGGVKYRLEFGPPEMELSETGLITWTPAEIPFDGYETVFVQIQDGAGATIFYRFAVTLVAP